LVKISFVVLGFSVAGNSLATGTAAAFGDSVVALVGLTFLLNLFPKPKNPGGVAGVGVASAFFSETGSAFFDGD
jgi:hypothetical protein